jgi:hypothetical protein
MNSRIPTSGCESKILLATVWILLVALFVGLMGPVLFSSKLHGVSTASAKELTNNQAKKQKPASEKGQESTYLDQAQAPSSLLLVLPLFLEFTKPLGFKYLGRLILTKLVVPRQYAIRLPVLLTCKILQTSILAKAP